MNTFKKHIPIFIGFTAALLLNCSKKEISIDKVDKTDNPSLDIPPVKTKFLGSLVGINKNVREGSTAQTSSGNPIYNQPLFLSSANEADWWDNIVEEFDYSRQDFFAVNCRGYQPTQVNQDHGDPRKITELVRAMYRRGVQNNFKISVFDDCPSSWAANSNYLKGIGYTTSTKFDCADTSNYKYIWDYNLKVAFEHIPEDMRFTYMGRPVIFFWSVHDTWAINIPNNLSKILIYIRSEFKKTFGQNPFLIVSSGWINRDPSVNHPLIADAVHNWFTVHNRANNSSPNRPWTEMVYNKITLGSGIPGFIVEPSNMFVDSRSGEQLTETLRNTMGNDSHITLIEGFTDASENAALFRSKDTVYYDYPNQRINIMRRFSNNPYPPVLKVEAEACDFFKDLTVGNIGNTYRTGDIDIEKCYDKYGGWNVFNTQAGEWLEWKEIPIKKGNSKLEVRYSSLQPVTIQFSIDGIDLPIVNLTPTGNGKWLNRNAGSIDFSSAGLHNIRFKIISGDFKFNYFNIMNNK